MRRSIIIVPEMELTMGWMDIVVKIERYTNYKVQKQVIDLSKEIKEDLPYSDTVTRIKWTSKEINVAVVQKKEMLMVIFILFEATFGLHINWNKSFMYPINYVDEIHNMDVIFGGSIGELPIVYLRMSLGAKSNYEKKRIHLIKWASLAVSKKDGGLGIKKLRVQDQRLMLKWL
ncbi:hypothetical protein H5410_036124 [Solanum commersonii]|uniref:Uncharacterized protein n=1 Tax=Solanum commersonii TaxID=4109 RepID=A0A9J5Y6M4_SOLCO|nr:hypothetical protein H5410_036124 [Solanum commersonii]